MAGTKIKVGKLALLMVIVAAVGGAIAWVTCSSSCVVLAEPSGTGPSRWPGALVTWFGAAVASVATWFLASFLGKPLVEIEAKRREALQMAERYAKYPEPRSDAGMERLNAAQSALFDIAADLRILARGLSAPLALYCRLAGYDLEQAALVIGGLAGMAGDDRYSEELKTNKSPRRLLFAQRLRAHVGGQGGRTGALDCRAVARSGGEASRESTQD